MKWFNPMNKKITAFRNQYKDIQASNKNLGKVLK